MCSAIIMNLSRRSSGRVSPSGVGGHRFDPQQHRTKGVKDYHLDINDDLNSDDVY